MKISKILTIFLCLGCATGFYSCSDDSDLPDLSFPAPKVVSTSFKSLEFSWEPVANAVQYGYRLSNLSDKSVVATAVTRATSVTFDRGLEPATTYNLEVWAFAAMEGEYSTPHSVSITAATDPLTKLTTPVVTLTTTTNSMSAQWEKVEHVDTYVFEVVSSSDNNVVKSGTSKRLSTSIKNLSHGDYVFTIQATTTEEGFENSEVSRTNFTIN